MNAYLKLNTQSQEMLLIPSQAVIDTGKEQRVITVDDEGRFVPKKSTFCTNHSNSLVLVAG